MAKGIFIPDITVEMMRKASLEAVETLLVEGEMCDVDIPKWIPCSKRLPSDEDYDETFTVTIQCEHYDGWDDYVTGYAEWTQNGWDIQSRDNGQIKVTAWMPLPKAYGSESE